MNDTLSGKPDSNEFLEHRGNRRKRLIDAIKILPILGAFLFLFPALLLGDGMTSTSTLLVYFFVMWAVLLTIWAVLLRALKHGDEG